MGKQEKGGARVGPRRGREGGKQVGPWGHAQGVSRRCCTLPGADRLAVGTPFTSKLERGKREKSAKGAWGQKWAPEDE